MVTVPFAASGVPARRRGAVIVLWAVLAFGLGVSAVAWRTEHQRVLCYRDFAEEELVADSKCEQLPFW